MCKVSTVIYHLQSENGEDDDLSECYPLEDYMMKNDHPVKKFFNDFRKRAPKHLVENILKHA
jgi:hypothetical protein